MSTEYRLYQKEDFYMKKANMRFVEKLKQESQAAIARHEQEASESFVDWAKEVFSETFTRLSAYEPDSERLCTYIGGQFVWHKNVASVEGFVKLYPDCIVVDEYGKVYALDEFWRLTTCDEQK